MFSYHGLRGVRVNCQIGFDIESDADNILGFLDFSHHFREGAVKGQLKASVAALINLHK